MSVSLESLFIRANVNRYNQDTWFTRAVLKSNLLLIDATPDALAFVQRHYLPKMRELISDLEIRPHPPKASQPVKAPTRFPALKPGRYRDLLDADVDL